MDELARFQSLVLQEEPLQRRLLAECGEEAFCELVVQLAAERGLAITPADVVRALRDARHGAVERYGA